jgi:hypothetical protein
MTPDAHTACAGCPAQVRGVHDAAYVLVFLLEQRTDPLAPAELEALAVAHAALDQLAPFVTAHRANQLHAFSPELLAARMPKLTIAVVTREETET